MQAANNSLHILQSLINTLSNSTRRSSIFSFLFLLPLLVLLLCTQYFFFLRRKHAAARIKLPPTPRFSVPLIGHLHLLRSTLHISLRDLSQKHGPLIRINLGQIPTVVASSPEIAAKILKTHDTHFCTRPSLAATSRYSYGRVDIAFSPYNHHWMQLRRFVSAHLFNPSKVQSMRGIREQEVEAMVNSISVSSPLMNVKDTAMSLFINIIFREMFGKRAITDGDDDGRMRSRYHELFEEVAFFMGDFSLGDLFPSLAWLDVVRGWKGRLDRSFRALNAVLEEEILQGMKRKQRHDEAGQLSEEEDMSCFLDVLLPHLSHDDILHKGKNIDSHGLMQLNRVEAKAVLMNMIIGGTDDAATTIEWAMTNLMRNPEVMRKAQEEVRQLVGNKKHVKESDLHELCYLKMVIKETLRLHPPAPLLLHRECLKDTTIEGYNIPANTRVLVNAWAIGRDPKSWDDPEAFRPERFEGSPITYLGNHFQFIPFGAGRRICPGMALGMIGVELAMANLLYSFNWDFPAGMSRSDVSLNEAFGIVAHKKMPLLLVPTAVV